MDLEILYLLTVTISSEPGNIISINGDTQFSSKNSILDLKLIFHFFENLNFQFSSKTHFLDHKFEDPSCRICSYGPHGPFWFSVNNRRDMVNRYQKNNLGEQSLFEIITKMNQFIRGKFSKAPGISSQKLSYVRLLP